MKTYNISDDRVLSVKKSNGQLMVTMRVKDIEHKFVEFTPSR